MKTPEIVRYKFTLDMVPLATANRNMIVEFRSRKTGQTMKMIRKTKEATAWVELATLKLRIQAKGMGLKTIETPVSLSMDVWCKSNQSDLDNFYKGVCDALESSGVLRNDKLIKEHRHCRCLVDRLRPRIELVLEPLEGNRILFPLD